MRIYPKNVVAAAVKTPGSGRCVQGMVCLNSSTVCSYRLVSSSLPFLSISTARSVHCAIERSCQVMRPLPLVVIGPKLMMWLQV